MSTTLLRELNEEVRRLYIAGSGLAAGDFRLKRLLPQFEQLGARSPVFKRLGDGIRLLAEPSADSEHEAAQNLQELNQLLSAVLRTQGTTAPEGELTPLEGSRLRLPAGLSFRKLSPVKTALTTTGSGRYEIILEAHKEGLFRDLRLLPSAVEALGDPYSEIAELAAQEIVPSYDSAIIPYLLETFDPEGGKKEARKLQVMAALDHSLVKEVILQAAEGGSDEVRTAAIRLLAGYKEYEAIVLDYSRSKKKAIRESAYEALAASGWDEAVDRLYEAFQGKDRELVVFTLSRCQSSRLTEKLVRDLESELDQARLNIKDKSKTEDIWIRVKSLLWALGDKESPQLENVYRSVLHNYSLYMASLGWVYLMNEAVQYFNRMNTQEARELLRDNTKQDLLHFRKSSSYVTDVFRKAQLFLQPESVYEEYADILLEGYTASPLSGAAKERKRLIETISDLVIYRKYGTYRQVWHDSEKEGYTYLVDMISRQELAERWDSRWLDHFIEQDESSLVSAFAVQGHPEAAGYLLHKLRQSPEFRNRYANLIVMGLDRAGVEENILHEAIMAALEDERNTECTMIEPFVFEKLCQLPDVYAERIRAVLPRYAGEAEDQLRYILRQMNSF